MLDFKQTYFQLFDLPKQCELDGERLGQQFRRLQQSLHPDRFAGSSDYEQRVAVQYSALVNQAYTALRDPLARSLYLLQLEGMEQDQVSAQKVDGGFLMEQMELREKLESAADLVDPEPVLEHLLDEILASIKLHQGEFAQAYCAQLLPEAAVACVKMQYLVKLQQEAEQLESDLLDSQ